MAESMAPTPGAISKMFRALSQPKDPVLQVVHIRYKTNTTNAAAPKHIMCAMPTYSVPHAFHILPTRASLTVPARANSQNDTLRR
jgi:hypothetical protein